MWPSRFFAKRFFATRFWARGIDADVADIDYSTDYLWRTNFESVTVTIPSTAGTTVVSRATREFITARRAYYSGVSLSGKELIWNIPITQHTTRIQPGDATVTDADGIVWNVKRVKKTYVGRSPLDWECVCLRQR